ncbi:hypothetical protein Nepgr_011795 [Nepenthes gracilis]|uniref:Uncharacterized protein n=1 Tax=Nepenthes gracilis TaxID=150966 RepID=A0AAD3SFQ8_NEPGR|nr:hypothetical protein Nepgr_011795 [Nepenthes gracilis]
MTILFATVRSPPVTIVDLSRPCAMFPFPPLLTAFPRLSVSGEVVRPWGPWPPWLPDGMRDKERCVGVRRVEIFGLPLPGSI